MKYASVLSSKILLLLVEKHYRIVVKPMGLVARKS